MPVRFTVLGSGSGGNSSFLEADGYGLLLDAGLGPRQIAVRLAAVGATWNRVHAVLLTHTHSDHWNERTFSHLRRHKVPLYCHPSHHADLTTYGWEFTKLQEAGLVRPYESEGEFTLSPGLRCRPLPLPHDGGATFGFRFETPADTAGRALALGYLADLGSWTADLASTLANVDVLALEFNHDVDMECTSGRSARLIARVLGDQGHLSNEQAAALLGEVMRLSEPGRVKHLVQLHLSRDCNRADLAEGAARAVLNGAAAAVQLHTASQYRPGPCLVLGAVGEPPLAAPAPPPERKPRRRPPLSGPAQPWLPGWDG
jgi:phosphoribosyl 1,2-cyclic phosphodiesterase